MAHPPEKRLELRTAYIGGLPLEAAADKAEVPYATARNWFRAARESGDDWDKFRAASLIVAGGGIEQAMGRIIAAGLMRCEALLEQLDTLDPEKQLSPSDAVKAMATLGDTVAKLRASGKDPHARGRQAGYRHGRSQAPGGLYPGEQPTAGQRLRGTASGLWPGAGEGIWVA